jgi:hypothetical protein
MDFADACNPFLDSALAYARRGWRVLNCLQENAERVLSEDIQNVDNWRHRLEGTKELPKSQWNHPTP